MSGEKVVRYTAEQMEAMARTLHYSGTDEFSDEAASMLAQAANAEADVAGLVEALNSIVNNIETGASLACVQRIAFEQLARFQP